MGVAAQEQLLEREQELAALQKLIERLRASAPSPTEEPNQQEVS